jgi:hypothetical protein
MSDTETEEDSNDDSEQVVSIKDSEAVTDGDDGEKVLKMESLQKGGGDPDAVLDESTEED